MFPMYTLSKALIVVLEYLTPHNVVFQMIRFNPTTIPAYNYYVYDYAGISDTDLRIIV